MSFSLSVVSGASALELQVIIPGVETTFCIILCRLTHSTLSLFKPVIRANSIAEIGDNGLPAVLRSRKDLQLNDVQEEWAVCQLHVYEGKIK